MKSIESMRRPQLKIRRVNLDTGHENVAIMSRHSRALRPDVFRGFSRIELHSDAKVLLATLLITDDESLVGADELVDSTCVLVISRGDARRKRLISAA
jgi:thymidine phosphorylase